MTAMVTMPIATRRTRLQSGGRIVVRNIGTTMHLTMESELADLQSSVLLSRRELEHHRDAINTILHLSEEEAS